MTLARTGMDALAEMRTRRRRNRVAELEWFDALYRVYLAAFLGGWAILFLSDLAGDGPLSPTAVADLRTHGAPFLGLVVAVLVHLGVSGGVNGGPLSVEEADVRHVLLAPVPLARALRRPVAQRLRSMAFAGGLVGGVAGQLLGRRMTGSGALLEWFVYGAVAGAAAVSASVAAAMLAHASRLPRGVLLSATSALVCWQAVAIDTSWNVVGPFDTLGSFALWGLGVHAVDAVALLVVAAAVGVSFAVAGRMSLELLSVRSALVSQMRFAVTLQDIRTVVLLRRQLAAEHMRPTPWVRIRAGSSPVVTRGMRGIVRFPARRLVRMVAVAVAGTVCLVETWRDATPFVALAGVLFFLLGLELLEPLSQQIDQADLADALPAVRGDLHVRHLVAPAIASLPFVLASWAVASLVVRTEGSVLAVMALSFVCVVCAVGAGLAGATINVVKGAPDPASDATQGLALPPEVSGMGTVLRNAWPPAVAVLGALPVVALRETHSSGDPLAPVAVRTTIAVGVLVALVVAWVHRRDDIRAWFNDFASGTAKKIDASVEGGPTHGN